MKALLTCDADQEVPSALEASPVSYLAQISLRSLLIPFLVSVALQTCVGEPQGKTPRERDGTPIRENILFPGTRLEHEMGRGDRQLYWILLKKGQFAHVEVMQKGVDVVVKIIGPNGRTAAQMDSLNGRYGPEPISVIAEVSGYYCLEIDSFEARASGGRYEIRVADPRPSTPQDGVRIKAEKEYADGVKLRSEKKPPLEEARRKLQDAVSLFAVLDDGPRQAASLYALADVLASLGRPDDAASTYDHARRIFKQVGDDLGQANCLVDLANLYSNQDKYLSAEPLYNQALNLIEQVLGRNAEIAASPLESLASVYTSLDKLQDAQAAYERAVAIREASNNSEPTILATDLTNLGLALQKQGKYAEAEARYRGALQIHQQVLPENKSAIANDLNNLGVASYYEKKYTEANALLQQALTLFTELTGPESQGVAAVLGSMGSAMSAQGDYKGAEPKFERALQINERVFGESALATSASLVSLAEDYENESKYALAEPLLVRALHICEQLLPKNHPGIAYVLNDLANTYSGQHKSEEAESCYRRALAIYEISNGTDSSLWATTASNLCPVLAELGKYSEAEQFVRHAIQVHEKVPGESRSELAADFHHLAAAYVDQGKYAEALPRIKESLEIHEKELGLEHPIVAIDLTDFAMVEQKLGEPTKAVTAFERVMGIHEKVLGRNDQAVFLDLVNLCVVYTTLGRYSDRRGAWERALAIIEHNYGSKSEIVVTMKKSGALEFGGFESIFADYVAKLEGAGSTHSQVASGLKGLAAAYENNGKFADAERTLLRALKVQREALGDKHVDVAETLVTLAELYNMEGKYNDATPLANEAIEIDERAFQANHPSIASALSSLADSYTALGRYLDAEPLYRRSLAIKESVFGGDSPLVITDLYALGGFYEIEGRFPDSERVLGRALTITEDLFGQEHQTVARALTNLADLYTAEGRFPQAEANAGRALAIQEKIFGLNHPNLVAALESLANLNQEKGDYVNAERLHKRALAICESPSDKQNRNLRMVLNNLAIVYLKQNNRQNAEPLFLKALAIGQKMFGDDSAAIANTLNNLSALYVMEGRYPEAEPLAERALDAHERAFGRENPIVLPDLSNLADLNRRQGRYAQAEKLFDRILTILKNTYGYESSKSAEYLSRLAILYVNEGKLSQAEEMAQKALEIDERTLGQDHTRVSDDLTILGAIFTSQAKYATAETAYRRALSIDEKSLGLRNPVVATDAENLASLLATIDKDVEAEQLYLRAQQIDMVSDPNFGVWSDPSKLAMLYYKQGKYPEAQPLIEARLRSISQEFDKYFPHMSEEQRLLFLYTVQNSFFLYFSFCSSYKNKDPGLVGKMYDVLLWQKGLVARSMANLKTKLQTGGDQDALSLFLALADKKSWLAQLWTTNTNHDRSSTNDTALVQKAEDQVSELEKEVFKRTAALGIQMRPSITWRDVQRALRPDEAAIEFVSFPYFDGKSWSKTAHYVALVVTPHKSDGPSIIDLGSAADLEPIALQEYGTRITPGVSNILRPRVTEFYDRFWKPLEIALPSVKRIYISPDGVLNQVVLGIAKTDDGYFLMEKYDLRTLFSTGDLCNDHQGYQSKTAILFGDPTFDLEETRQRELVHSLQLDGGSALPAPPASVKTRPDNQGAGPLERLPGTRKEVEQIRAFLETKGWHVEEYVGDAALEETLKHIHGPRILHLATHGFLFSDKSAARSAPLGSRGSGENDPMLRSGLLFAGAERVWEGAAPVADLDDGVLTAFEATSLDLHGTELVVLSACDTGLGELRRGEGVLGLRRAVQEAGAESVLISMWEVPNRETRELMNFFYSKWLSGKNKHDAFREAQFAERLIVKSRYGRDLPYYWGAFALAGQ